MTIEITVEYKTFYKVSILLAKHHRFFVLAGFPVLFVSRSFGHITSVARNVLCVPKTFDSLVAFCVCLYFGHSPE